MGLVGYQSSIRSLGSTMEEPQGRGGNGGNSLVGRRCSPSEQIAMVVVDMLKHRGGASTTGHERPATVHAGRLPGGRVVGSLDEVIPHRTSVRAASDGTVWRGDHNVGRRSGRAGSREGRQRVIRGGVMRAGGSVSDAMGVQIQLHGSAQGCNRW